jgi:membrane protease YdiL (CAAX protease family)
MKKTRTPHILLICVIVLQFVLAELIELSNINFTVTQAIIISQVSILIPFAIYCLISRKNPLKVIRFKKINMLSAFMAFLVAIFSYPVVIFLNLVSMLFVENAVADIIPSVLQQGLGMGLLLMALLPAVVEETIFRGTLYNTYSKYNPLAGVLLSAVLFGFMHMNFNQIPYAIYMGIVAALLLEACDSIVAPMILHFTLNGSSLVLAFVTGSLQGDIEVPQVTDVRAALIESFRITAQDMNLPLTEAEINAMGPIIIIGCLISVGIFALMALAFVLVFIYITFCVNKRKPKEVFRRPVLGQKERLVDLWVIVFMLYAIYECIKSL